MYKKLDMQAINAELKKVFDSTPAKDYERYDPYTFEIIEAEWLGKNQTIKLDLNRQILVHSMYDYVFRMEKDFDKALEVCCAFANRKIQTKINEYCKSKTHVD